MYDIPILFRFGGKYVPETLIPALSELEVEYKKAQADPKFKASVLQCAFLLSAALKWCLLQLMPHMSCILSFLQALSVTCTHTLKLANVSSDSCV
eukprot:scaffold36370_cov21-Tisochrysis_lutea.AAC.2